MFTEEAEVSQRSAVQAKDNYSESKQKEEQKGLLLWQQIQNENESSLLGRVLRYRSERDRSDASVREIRRQLIQVDEHLSLEIEKNSLLKKTIFDMESEIHELQYQLKVSRLLTKGSKGILKSNQVRVIRGGRVTETYNHRGGDSVYFEVSQASRAKEIELLGTDPQYLGQTAISTDGGESKTSEKEKEFDLDELRQGTEERLRQLTGKSSKNNSPQKGLVATGSAVKRKVQNLFTSVKGLFH